tara:strand:- start:6064 stop:6207 length:144 start_codon:yes stop_codon:yes gene_type:complete
MRMILSTITISIFFSACGGGYDNPSDIPNNTRPNGTLPGQLDPVEST